MRLKTSIFVSALLRQTSANGGFGTILNKGAEEAGAIFIVHVKARDQADFYGPAPQSFFYNENSGDRLFELLGSNLNEHDVAGRIRSQLSFDPDCWIVELELSGRLEGVTLASDE